MPETEIKINAGGVFDEVLSKGQKLLLTVTTKSMLPFLRPDDGILVKKISFSSLQPGDIVAFKRNGEIHVHRFLFRKNTDAQAILITKGDNAWVFDSPVGERDFLGKGIEIRKKHGRIRIESIFWKVIFSMVTMGSVFQGYTYQYLRKLKRMISKH